LSTSVGRDLSNADQPCDFTDGSGVNAVESRVWKSIA
jgi:hypothetical protein